MSTAQQVLSVNTSRLQALVIGDRTELSGICKRSVSSADAPQRIAVRAMGLAGDEQADPTVHGGLAKAVYAYPQEHYAFWQTVRAQAGQQAWDDPLPAGFLGENLTVTGLLEGDAYVGDVLRFPDCTLAISEPRRPCHKFAAVMGFAQSVKLMAQSGYCGYYLSVRQEGSIAAGDFFELIPGPRELSMRELFLLKMRQKR